MEHIFIGTSGWSYPGWKGRFYPADIPQKDWFSFYSRQFSTVEINATFYQLPKLKTIHGWRPGTVRFRLRSQRQPLYHPHQGTGQPG